MIIIDIELEYWCMFLFAAWYNKMFIKYLLTNFYFIPFKRTEQVNSTFTMLVGEE